MNRVFYASDENVRSSRMTTRPTSYIFVRLSDGKGVFETWNPAVAAKVNRAKYKVMTAHDYLCGLNNPDLFNWKAVQPERNRTC